MGFLGGVLRLRFWLQLVTVAALAACANLALAAVAPGEAGARSPIQLAPVSAPAAAPGSAGGYSRATVAVLRYGSGSADVGLRTGAERRPVGPSSFAVERGGRILVADVVNGRIQVFAPDGKHERSVSVASPLHDLTVDDAGVAYALSTDGGLTAYDTSTGRQADRWALEPELARSLGHLRAQDGLISLEAPNQLSYPVYVAGGSVGLRAQEAAQKKGAKGPSGYYYSTSYRDQGHLYRLDAQGKVVLDVALKLSDVASVNFLGEDRSGSAYVVVERFGAKNQVSVEVRKLDRGGALTATIPAPPVTLVEMTRSILVTDSGDIYELLPEANGASVLRWRKP